MGAVIDSFMDEYHFLSNFSEEGKVKPTVEHYYQAAKTLDPNDRDWVMEAPTPGQAKRRGRKVELRPDWEQVKIGIMLGLLLEKFDESEIQAKLLATGDARLIEGNTWHDTYWGVHGGVGENWLGRLLEVVRSCYAI